MPVLVQNLQDGPTVYSDGKDLHVEWKGKGDPSGEDLQEVPDEVTKSGRFARAIRQGILAVVEASDEVREQISAQDRQWAARQAAEARQAQASIDPAVDKDYVSLPCIGPDDRGHGTCQQAVPVPTKEADNALVLCDRHRSLASQFIQEETGETKVKGDALVPVTRWVRVRVDAREKAL